ncbi:MAG: hypothetical protein ACRDTE_13775 [Pseudonocardiaceae bacterium]
MTYCTTCGTSRDAGSLFCTGCGKQISAELPAPSQGDAHDWPPGQPRTRSRARLVATLTTVALLLGAGGVTAWAALTNNGNDSSLPPSPSRTMPPEQSQAATSTSQPTSPPSGLNSEDTALNQLTRQISLDRPQVQRELTEAWVAQLSSKQWGLVVDGMTYRYTDILNDHLALRSAHDARLVWSGEWSSFREGDFYVTVAPVPFSTPAEANAWCDSQGIDPKNCFAKRLSTVAGPEGSTVNR